MKSFLLELAEKLYKSNRPLNTITLIFPNRRASLYFRKHLSTIIQKPTFAPTLLTLEDFIKKHSTLQVPDKLELISRLHKTYQQTVKSDEPFDEFYFWGEMLLRDFEEIDRYLVNAPQLFKDLSHQKELDSSFDFLTEEQLVFLRTFWNNFDENLSANKKKFLHIWRQLPDVYETFKEQLKAEGLAFEGMLHREVANRFSGGGIDSLTTGQHLMFVGFNALTKAEEKIICHCVEHLRAEVHWDTDAYYVNSIIQEGGLFFREYQQHAILGKTFSDVPSNFNTNKSVQVIGAPQHVGQAKLMAQLLQEELQKGILPEEILIVLPDEKLMLPVLHGISSTVDKLNITMGLSLSSTPLFNMVELLIELQINKRGTEFNHRQALSLLGHPYVVAADIKAANEKRKAINKQNQIHIPAAWLQTECPLHDLIFSFIKNSSENGAGSIIDYLRAIITRIGSLKTLTDLDKEYCFHFLTLLNRMDEVVGNDPLFYAKENSELSSRSIERDKLKSFLRLFRQVVRIQKIPFAGEPLSGLQVMGVLETRNIDFKNVFILSLNEGALPSTGGKGSYIPYNIRKAYSMPTPEHQDAIYAYLFYRVMQRAENIFLFYNTETDVLGQGEMSRYLQQVIYESGWDIKRKTLHNPIQPQPVIAISIAKNTEIMNKLAAFIQGHPSVRGFYPTNIIDYLECRLRFYFKHIANIRDAIEVEDDMDARVLGNLVHKVMQHFYQDLLAEYATKLVDPGMLETHKKKIPELIDRVFIETYKLDPDKPVEYDGQRLIVREIAEQFTERIIEKDIEYAPFIIEGIERDGLTYGLPISGGKKIMLKGKVDRIDNKDDIVRVIDYKTGKDKVEMSGLAVLFSREGELSKASFQTLYYALLYKTNYPHVRNINAGIFNRNTLFADEPFGLKLGPERLPSVERLLPEFENFLQTLLLEIFNPDQPFDQTTNTNNCINCSYRNICYR
jgi:CRISPR/Cas system-associated exonuclease Cas4 (RecB family)